MIQNLTFLKPQKERLGMYMLFGILFFLLGIYDLISNTFFDNNITSFLPKFFSFFTPLLFSFLGLHLIRIEYSGNRILDLINININSNWFNAILTLLVIFTLIISIPGLLNWTIFEANFIGTSKEECTGSGACWIFINVWFERLMYGLYPNDQIWRINIAFIALIFTVGAAFFVPTKNKKYIIIFLLFVFPFILIFLLSGGNLGLEKIPTNEWGGLALTFIISIFAILFCFL